MKCLVCAATHRSGSSHSPRSVSPASLPLSKLPVVGLTAATNTGGQSPRKIGSPWKKTLLLLPVLFFADGFWSNFFFNRRETATTTAAAINIQILLLPWLGCFLSQSVHRLLMFPDVLFFCTATRWHSCDPRRFFDVFFGHNDVDVDDICRKLKRQKTTKQFPHPARCQPEYFNSVLNPWSGSSIDVGDDDDDDSDVDNDGDDDDKIAPLFYREHSSFVDFWQLRTESKAKEAKPSAASRQKNKEEGGRGWGRDSSEDFLEFFEPRQFQFFFLSFFLSFLTGVHWLAVRSLYEAAAAAAVMRPKLSPPDYNNHPGQPLADHKVTRNVFATLITVSSNCRSTKLLEQNLSWNATYLPTSLLFLVTFTI